MITRPSYIACAGMVSGRSPKPFVSGVRFLHAVRLRGPMNTTTVYGTVNVSSILAGGTKPL